jgi:hypothetical protein
MPENGSELRRIVWSEVFPFVRLFTTLRLSLNINRLFMALLGLTVVYIGGRVLDGLWGTSGGVTIAAANGELVTEVQVYAQTEHDFFDQWKQDTQQDRAGGAIRAVRRFVPDVKDDQAARARLADSSLRALLIDDKTQTEIDRLRTLVEQRLEAGLAAIDDGDAFAAEQRRQLHSAADVVRIMLAGKWLMDPSNAVAGQAAIETIIGADPNVEADQRGTDLADLRSVADRVATVAAYERTRPRGPFIALIEFEQHCFAAAIQGACNGRLGFAGGAFDRSPSMAGSIWSAARGGCWLVNQHLWYAVFITLLSLVTFAYFGGGICRSAAVQSARDESISIRESLEFVSDRYTGFITAPLLPVVVGLLIAIVMIVGGWIGAIPFIGELFTGAFYPLALLGGFALTMLALATVLGFHLMWPTIAVEGSDGFDALSRACSYVGSRIWHLFFYWVVLLVFGAFSFVLVRLIVLVTLKMSHGFTGAGMNAASSAATDSLGKLNAMWSMPAWSDLSLLPDPTGPALWGTFRSAPLGMAEPVGAWLLMVWIFLVVGLLASFTISYFYCGATQVYFLLRRDVDATDYDEVYYEEPEDELPPPAVAAAQAESAAKPADAPPESGAAGKTDSDAGDKD